MRTTLFTLTAMLFTLLGLLLTGCTSTTAGYAALPPAQVAQYQAPVVQVAQLPVQYAAAPCAPQVAMAAPCAPQAYVQAPVQYAAAQAPCAAQAGQVPVQVLSAQPMANGQQLVAVQYKVGAEQWTRATLQVPGNVVLCFGQFLYCALDALFPKPTPQASLVQYQQPQVQYVQLQQAPAAACGPCGR